MVDDNGGWTVIQRRMDGSVDFDRGWDEYVHGFGNLSGEHWLGLSKIHRLANESISVRLRLDMTDMEGNNGYGYSSTFYIGGSSNDYTLYASWVSGTIGNSLSYHYNRKFTTKDDDNDEWPDGNNAERYSGGWWYHKSYHCNLNGLYNETEGGKGIVWTSWKPNTYSIPFVEMKIRRN